MSVRIRALIASIFLLGVAAGGVADADAATIVVSSGATQFAVGADGSGADAYGCAVVEGGAVECWGEDVEGELGNGTTSLSPTGRARVVGLSGVDSVSAAGGHVCALLGSGTVKCWGSNDSGELGNGTVTQNSPLPVTVSGLSGAVAIGTGPGISCAVLADGTARCWGANAYGSLGDGTVNPSPVPVVVSGLTGAVAIKPGSRQTCALLQTGAVECWGWNGYEGTLGNGTETSSLVPVPVSGVSQATGLSSSSVTCAPLFDGTVRCWGANTNGYLGDGSTARTLTPVSVSGLGGVREVSVGTGHSCALQVDSSLWCWGQNYGDQLDLGAADWTAAPVRMNISGVLDVEAGEEFTCALLVGGAIECWGDTYGRLAEPSIVPEPEAEPGGKGTGGGNGTGVPGGPPIVKITAHPPRETADQSAAFEFAGVADGSYECSVDGGAWKPCASGDSFGPLQPGDHRFEVRETLKGVTGPAASWSWTVDLPRACVIKVARARVFAFTHQSKARLVIHYKAYAPARVTVSYSAAGASGNLDLGSASARFATAGIFRLGEKLDRAAVAKLGATSSMKVRFQVPQAPSSCARYYTKRLTIPRKVFGQTVWFQADSVFGAEAK